MKSSISSLVFAALVLGCGGKKEEPAAAPPPEPQDAAEAIDAAEPVDAPEVDAPELDAAVAPVFTDPASAEIFTQAQEALAQLKSRGTLHARYPEDCPAVWANVEASSLAKEQDPAAIQLVEDVARFCLHDLALKFADKRLEVIETLEDALEKKVNKFGQDTWDRTCGLPIETLAKAAKRYPDEPELKALAAPIIKRCGKRP